MMKLPRVLVLVSMLITVQGWLYAKHIAIIDAGSSGSRIYLFDVNYHAVDQKVTAINLLDKNAKVMPGIATYAAVKPGEDMSGAIKSHLCPLIDKLGKAVAVNSLNKKEIPIYLFATAGMRTVSPTNQTAVYEAVRGYLRAAGYTTVDSSSVQTISGEMEGIFDWCAVNLENFKEDSPTLGVLDMGGGSMQVAYARPDSGMVVRIGEAPTASSPQPQLTYNVCSRSYLGLGADYARYQYSNEGDCFFKGFPMPDGIGTGNFDNGLTKINNLLASVAHIATIQPTLLPNVEGFCAISAFYNIAANDNFYGTTPSKPYYSFTLDGMTKRAKELANKTWWEVGPKDQFTFSLLFTAQHIIEVLKDLGFKEDTEITAKDCSWPVGAAVYLAYNPLVSAENAADDEIQMTSQQLQWNNEAM